MSAMVSPREVARVLGLAKPVRSVRELASAVERGLPKSTLRSSAARIYEDSAAQTELIHRIVPEATLKRRRDLLKPDESARTERLARVIATAVYVWNDDDDARRFLTTRHSELGNQRPVDLALSELGAREVEDLLWKLYYGSPV